MLSSRRVLENILIFVSIVACYYLFADTDLSQKINKHLYGTFVSSKSSNRSIDDVVIITIDDKSVNLLEKSWPWSRSYHAALVELLTKAGTKAIGYDVLFLEASDNDAEFMESLQENQRIVLPSIDYSITRYQQGFQKYVQFGHDALEPDNDGILRSINLYTPSPINPLPAFSLAVLSLVDSEKADFYKSRVEAGENKLYFLFGQRTRFQTYSFADVLIGKIPLNRFSGKVVFIGTTLAGVGEKFIPIYRDRYQSFSGVEIQAHLFEALRSGDVVKIIGDSLKDSVNLTILLLVLLITRGRRFSPAMTNALGIAFVFCLAALSYILFQTTYYWLSLANSLIVATVYMFIYSIAAMQYRLKEANKTLEANVERRTQELKETNFNLAQEIQERKTVELSLRNNEHDLRVLLDSLQIGIITIDSHGKIITANRTIFLLLDTTYRKFVGRNISEFLKHSEAKGQMPVEARELVEALFEHHGSSVQIEGNVADTKDPIPVAITFSKVTQGEKNKFVCLIRDIRDQLRAEKMTQEFIATVSHELRTPITSVKGALELISSGVTGSLTPKAKNLLSIAVRNSNRLLTLVNDILDTQRIQLGTLEFHLVPLDLVELVEQSIEVNESYVQTYDVKINTKLPLYPIYVLGDYERLIQVMNNLISNAAKFSHSGGVTIDIRVMVDKRSARVEVIDYGQGVSDDFKSEIFKKFSQADDAKHRSKGTGLGLSITKALIERMSGKIDFYSQKGNGATFFFTLPILMPAEKKKLEQKVSKKRENIVSREKEIITQTMEAKSDVPRSSAAKKAVTSEANEVEKISNSGVEEELGDALELALDEAVKEVVEKEKLAESVLNSESLEIESKVATSIKEDIVKNTRTTKKNKKGKKDNEES